jgi:deoxyribonuclease-1
MARRTAARSSPRRRSKTAVADTPNRLRRGLRTALAKTRDLLIGLGVISAVSFLPPALTTHWPETAQRAVAVAGEVRDLSVDVAYEGASGAGALLLEAAAGLLDGGRALVDGGDLGLAWPDLGDWLGSLEGLVPSFDEWLPQPLPAGDKGALPRVAGSFSGAKDLMYGQVYRGHRITAYCGCRFERSRRTDLESCGMAAYAWNNADPPDAWEIKRNQRIERLQGIANPFVSDYRRL